MPGMKASKEIQGLPAAPGLASGPAHVWQEYDLTLPDPYPCEDPEEAWRKIRQAIDAVKDDLSSTRSQVLREVGKDEAAIFDAHIMMVEDVALHAEVKKSLKQGVNPEQAWFECTEQFAQMLGNIPDDTLSARAADVRDIGRQVLARLLGFGIRDNEIGEPSIIIARDLSPSQTVKMDKDKVLAFCTAEGGPTSHSAILSKALGIPAIVALGEAVLEAAPGDMLLVDAGAGKVILKPPREQIEIFDVQKKRFEDQSAQDITYAAKQAVTRDGVPVEVFANIGGVQDVESAIKHGAEGVGLFRTEFLYLSSNALPTIDQQIAAYRQVIEGLAERPLVVRTMDIGGDKPVEYLGIAEEPNPFLGWRAIRMIDEKPEVLRDQFYALLKAGQGTDIRIMVPMVSQIGEVMAAREIFDNVLAQVRMDVDGYRAEVQFGIMVEVPSAALMIEHFAPYVDFYSIGTNDLTQYTMAVDRMNARVAHLASPFSPAVLKLIDRTIRVAHQHNKWVGMCGEFAGDPLAVPFLLGVGLDEFSMAASAIPKVKRVIRQVSVKECKTIASQVLTLPDQKDIQAYLKECMQDILS